MQNNLGAGTYLFFRSFFIAATSWDRWTVQCILAWKDSNSTINKLSDLEIKKLNS